jgi:hypothetical protein
LGTPIFFGTTLPAHRARAASAYVGLVAGHAPGGLTAFELSDLSAAASWVAGGSAGAASAGSEGEGFLRTGSQFPNTATESAPHWMAPLVTVTTRLEQEYRYDQSRQGWPKVRQEAPALECQDIQLLVLALPHSQKLALAVSSSRRTGV